MFFYLLLQQEFPFLSVDGSLLFKGCSCYIAYVYNIPEIIFKSVLMIKCFVSYNKVFGE